MLKQNKKLIIYFREISASVDSGMTLQVLNDYGCLSSLNNEIVIPVYAKNCAQKKQIRSFILDNNFVNLKLFFLPLAPKKIRLIFLIFQIALIILRSKSQKKIIVIREKKCLLPARLLRRLFKATLVSELHVGGLPTNKKHHCRFQKLFKKINGILFTNKSQIQYLNAHGFDLPKYQIILPNGVNIVNLSKAEPASPKSYPIVLTYTGQFTSWKNVPLIFEALSYLPSNFHLRIAGGKKDSLLSKLYINDLVIKFSLSGRVDYVGFVNPNSLVEHVINGTAILLLPLGDSVIARYATSPMKLVEYMATSIPIVAVDAPSVRGLCGLNSIFLSKPNAKDFANKILQVYGSDPNNLKTRILNQKKIAKNYDFNVRASRYDKWLSNLTI